MASTDLATDRTRADSTHEPLMSRLGQVIRRSPRHAMFAIAILGILFWTLMPLLVVLVNSFKENHEIFVNPALLPQSISFSAYERVFAMRGFRQSFVNTVYIATLTTLLTLLIAVPAGYAFARFRFRARHVLLLFSLLPRLVPSLGLMLPLYALAARLDLIDSRLAIVVVLTGTILPFSVWVLMGFFEQVPREIEEASAVDGASLAARLWFVVLPMSVPALITIGVLAFREAWNEFELILALTSSTAARTLPYELYLLQGTQGGLPDHPAIAAFVVLTVLPLIAIYMRLEKYIVQGLTTGAVK